MRIENIEEPDGIVLDASAYLVNFWRRDIAAKTPYRVSEVRSVWEVTRWVEEQITRGDHVGEFPEVVVMFTRRMPDGSTGEPEMIPLTADYWGDVSAGVRPHPEPVPDPATALPGVD